MIRRLLEHPLARAHDIDDPEAVVTRRRIIREKVFLRRIYDEWYEMIVRELPSGQDPVLEIGAGAGFLNERIPDLITSEVFPCPGISVVMDATAIPYADQTLRAIVMTDVLHHISGAERFFSEAVRVLRKDGKVIMIEPWVSAWSSLIYGKFHHEPFDPMAADWTFPSSGPLSGANSALPWIIFERDRDRFERLFPDLKLISVDLCMPFRYLLSGGLSMRSLTPAGTFSFWKKTEALLSPLNRYLAMFAFIVLERK